jgi:hypothetical protein
MTDQLNASGKPEDNQDDWIPFEVRGIKAVMHCELKYVKLKDEPNNKHRHRNKFPKRKKQFDNLQRTGADYSLSKTMKDVLIIIRSLQEDKIKARLCEVAFLAEYISEVLKIPKKRRTRADGASTVYYHKERVYQLVYFIQAISNSTQ